jgi:hypothetical protein
LLSLFISGHFWTMIAKMPGCHFDVSQVSAHATDPTVIEEDVDVESLDALKESLILYMNEEVNQRTAETSDRQAGHVLWAVAWPGPTQRNWRKVRHEQLLNFHQPNVARQHLDLFIGSRVSKQECLSLWPFSNLFQP